MKTGWKPIVAWSAVLIVPAIASWAIGMRNLERVHCAVVAEVEKALDDVVPGRLHRPVISALQSYLAFGQSPANLCQAPEATEPACNTRSQCKLRVQRTTRILRVGVLVRPSVRLGRWPVYQGGRGCSCNQRGSLQTWRS